MSGYINVRSEFDKAVEVTVCERLLFVRASVGLLHLRQRWDRLREQPQGSRRSKYSTRGVVNDNQIGAKLQEIVNGPARSDVGRQRERRDGREPGEVYRVGNGGVLPPDARRAGGAAAEDPRGASAAAEYDAAADGRPAGGTGEEHEGPVRR